MYLSMQFYLIHILEREKRIDAGNSVLIKCNQNYYLSFLTDMTSTTKMKRKFPSHTNIMKSVY